MKLDPTLKGDWRFIMSGWWGSNHPMLAVRKEDNGKWYSYVNARERAKETPAFKTMREAMIDAERRYDAEMKKGKR